MKLALEHKEDLTQLGSIRDDLRLCQGDSVGAVWLVYKMACRLGIASALGDSRDGKLALWQVIARVIDQGSRLSAVRFAAHHGACDILDCDAFHEKHLYANLDWLKDNQAEIEKKLFRQLPGREKPDLFLLRCNQQLFGGQAQRAGRFRL
jgi:hypothetical protein